jgi:hypothetical protein
MEERRKLPRKHLIYYLPVYDNRNGALLGRLIDLTVEGMALVREDGLDVGSIHECRMELPRRIGDIKEIIFTAQCMRCSQDVNPDFMDAGFKIIAFTNTNASTVEGLIESFSFTG